MDPRQMLSGRVQHRHANEWYEMEERSEEHAPRDMDRDLARGRVFHCQQCDEYIRIVDEERD